jgi:hypothetical protein
MLILFRKGFVAGVTEIVGVVEVLNLREAGALVGAEPGNERPGAVYFRNGLELVEATLVLARNGLTV